MNDTVIDNTGQYNRLLFLKEESLRWILSVAGAILLFLPVTLIIEEIYHPSIEDRLELAKKLLIGYENALPEPMEAMLFHAGIVSLFIGMLLCYWKLSKAQLVKSLAKSPYYQLITITSIAAIIALIYFDFSALSPFPDERSVASTNFGFYFNGLILGGYFWTAYALLIFPLILVVFFIGLKKNNWEEKKLYNLIVSGTGYFFSAALVVAIVIMNTYSFPYSWQNKNDFSAVYYSVTQVFSGLPMLVNGLTDTYGLYPHFLVPLFRLTGLSVFTFSLVMSLLIAVSFVFNFIFLKKFVRNKIILFSGFFTMIFFPYMDFRLTVLFDSVFALYPIRYIIPATLTLLASIYFVKPSVKIYWFTFLLMACFVLWNPEFGIVCYASWVLTNIYHDWYGPGGAVQARKILLHLLAGACVVVGVFYAFKVLVFLYYHAWPDMSLLFSTMSVFENIGMNLLPMVLVHPWNIMALALCIGFLYAIVQWFKQRSSPKATIIFLTSLISLGFFFYFQGRSHNWVFAGSSGYCIMLLTLMADELWHHIKSNNLLLLNALFAIILFIISFSFFETSLNAGNIYALFYQEKDKTEQLLEQQNFENSKDFFLSKTAEHQKVIILSARKFPCLYFDGSKRMSAFNPGFIDMFFNSDVLRFENMLRDSSFDVFIEPLNLAHMPFLDRSLAIIGANYQRIDDRGSMYQLEKRKVPIPAQAFFDNTDAVVIHRKYAGDTAGTNRRVWDAAGINPIILNNEFSLQVLFYPGVQLFPFATVIGNDSDNNGFVLCKQLFSPNYLFGINDKTFAFPVPFDKWIYLVANVFPDHVDIYENGKLITSNPLSSPVRRSGTKLCIGNLGYMHYFIGAVSEVALTNKATDKDRVQQTWEKIDEVVNK